MTWILLLLGAILEVLGDVFFKKQSYILGAIFYGLGTLAWVFSLRYQTLSKAIVLFGVLNVLMATYAGCVVFKEAMTPLHWIGVALGLGCLAILS